MEFEYVIAEGDARRRSGRDLVEKLNELGGDGWEAVHMIQPWSSNARVLMKREVPG